MLLSYTGYLLFFVILNAMAFLLIYNDHQGKTIIKMFILFLILILSTSLFFYLIINDYTFLEANKVYAFITFSISILIFLMPYLIKNLGKTRMQFFIITVILLLMLLDVMLEYSLIIANDFIEVGEQTPDATVYATYERWSFSLKNPFYDLINVTSYWIAILHIILGVNDVIYALPNVILYFAIALLILLAVYIIYKRAKSQNVLLPAVMFALATPYITFITVPPALSAMFAILVIMLFIKQNIKLSDYITIMFLSIAGILTHTTAIAMLIFSLITLYLVSKLYGGNSAYVHYLRILVLFTVIYLIISFTRFIYTTAYVSLYPYGADFLKFFNFLSSPSSVELRITKYEQWSPIFTSFSWTIYPALAISYIMTVFFKKKHSYSELLAFSLLSAGLILIFVGFVGSYFSNSFSREVGYPGYMLLFLGSFEALKHINSNKIGKIMIFIIIIMTVLSGLFTVKNTPWLYVGKVPYLTFRSPTSDEVSMVERLLKLTDVENLIHLKIYQDFDPGIYAISLLKWGWIKPSNISSLSIYIQPLSKLINTNNSDIVFNSNLLLVLR